MDMKTPCNGILDYKIDTFDMMNSKTDVFKHQILEAIQSPAALESSEDALEALLQTLRSQDLKDENVISLNVTVDR